MTRRFRRRLGWKWPALALLLAGIVGKAALFGTSAKPAVPFEGACRVLEVIDGQTLLVQPEHKEVEPVAIRMIGIEIVESLATDAAAFTQERVAAGQVSLTLDKRRIDSQGRALAYVHVDGALLNAALIREGLARVVSYPGDSASFERELYRAQDVAVEERRGIWKSGQRPRSRASSSVVPEATIVQ